MDLLFNTSFEYFKQPKVIPDGTEHHMVFCLIRQKILERGIRQAIPCPEEISLYKWMAVHTFDIYNFCSKVYGILHAAFCNDYRCLKMTAGPKYEYTWMDGVIIKEPTMFTASQTIDFMMSWIRTQIDNQIIFPVRIIYPHPDNYVEIVGKIMKYLLRIYGHMYYIHYNELVILNEARIINAGLMHILFFGEHYRLFEDEDLEPFLDVIEYLKTTKDNIVEKEFQVWPSCVNENGSGDGNSGINHHLGDGATDANRWKYNNQDRSRGDSGHVTQNNDRLP